jgi:threonine dehydrogenase-like Zn-dependent dehydrogenase
MPKTITAAVQVAPNRIELQDLPAPMIGPDDGLLRVEATGICGSDIEQLRGELSFTGYPIVPGHEPLGVIEEVGERAAARWGVQRGDRVVVEAIIPCRACHACLRGQYPLCPTRFMHGFTPLSRAPGVWGGFATHLYLHPNSILHPVAPELPLEVAVLHNPMAAGVAWAVAEPGLRVGDTVAILGAGQRGLCCVIAARAAGARTIILTGLARDRRRLDLARELGADYAINVEEEDVAASLAEITRGTLADIVVDAASGSPQIVLDAIHAVRPGGTILLAGTKRHIPIQDLYINEIVSKSITIRGSTTGCQIPTYEQAGAIIASGRFPLERLHTHSFPLQDVRKAIGTLAGEERDVEAVHVAIVPGLEG